MGLLLTFCLMAMGLSVDAADKENESDQKEPAAMTQARKAYQAQVNSALMPIKKKYIVQLEELKKKLGGKGDLEGATAVQKEIVFIKSILSEDAGDKAEDKDVQKNESIKEAEHSLADEKGDKESSKTSQAEATDIKQKDSIRLINLEPEMAWVGWGGMVIGKDIKGDNDPNAGCRPFINNEFVKKDFIFALSPSHVRYAVPSGVKYFSAKIGSLKGKTNVTFKIIADRKVIFESGMSTWDKDVLDVAVELPAKSKHIDLIIDQPGLYVNGGHVNETYWAFPKFLKVKPDKLIPPPEIEQTDPPKRQKDAPEGRAVSLIKCKPKTARVGWGSMLVGKDAKDPCERPFIDNDLVMEDFLLAPCPSQVEYSIPKDMRFFSATIGNVKGKSEVTFKVIADGKELFTTNMAEWNNDVMDIVVELPMKSKNLGLVVEHKGGNAKSTYWAFPRFLASKPNDK